MNEEQMKLLFGIDMQDLQGQHKTQEAVSSKDFFVASYLNLSNYTNQKFPYFEYQQNHRIENHYDQ